LLRWRKSTSGALIIAGVVPGLILAGLYIIAIFLMTRMDPSAAPAYEVPKLSVGAKLALVMTDVVPMVGLMVVIVTLMIIGFATPSEAAAFGALGCDTASVVFRCFTWEAMKKSIHGALRVTLMAYLIVFGSATFSPASWPFQVRRAGNWLGNRFRP
jgi:TRAP-type mannitol/chloroaromatic compound transport system permease large subunit